MPSTCLSIQSHPKMHHRKRPVSATINISDTWRKGHEARTLLETEHLRPSRSFDNLESQAESEHRFPVLQNRNRLISSRDMPTKPRNAINTPSEIKAKRGRVLRLPQKSAPLEFPFFRLPHLLD
ncbi:hypothetical protein HPP92_023950 [Vanilla planifolia]|uniref:Uncharacterized protein n=1 Tax=Vanilla planifolia TaxID=51239 RepID=A0A835UAZ8_VANPL|nr:hypothetical protein HPP92_023950 [Vanilla planifolia]